MNDVAELIARLRLKDEMSGPLGRIRKSIGGFDTQMKGVGDRAYKAGQQVGTGIKRGAVIAAGAIGLISTQVYAGLKSLADLEKATIQTNAVLKSTKGVAGQTSESIRAMSEEFENLNATMDDKVIQSGANVLLTFTNIRKQAFKPTLEAALDLSQAMGQDLQTSIVQVGKALNDPIRGLTSLQRIGVSFTEQQKKQIKALVESGQTLKAQKIILAELNREFGGSFKAAGKSAEGTLAGIGDAVEDLQKALAQGLFPVIQKLLPKVRAALADPKVTATIERLGASIAELFNDQNLAEGGKILGSLFDTAKAAAPVVKDAAVATLGAVKAAVSLFTSLPKEVQQLAIGAFAINKITGGLVTNLAGGLISSVLKQLVSGVVNVNGGVVNVNGAGGLGGAAGAAGKAGSVLSAVGKVFIVGAAAGVFAELTGVLGDQSAANKEQALGLNEQTALYVKSASLQDMKNSLASLKDVSKFSFAEQIAILYNIDGVNDAILAQQRKLEVAIRHEEERLAGAAVRTKDDIVKAVAYESGSTRQKIESAKIANVSASAKVTAAVLSARDRIAAAARASGQQAAFAIRDKDLSVRVTNNNSLSVTTRVSVLETIKTTTTYKKIGNVYVS